MAALAFPYTKKAAIYSLHPICMCLFVWASISASILLQRVNPSQKSQAERSNNIRRHAILQILASVACCGGFWAIYQHRSNKGKQHWKSNHGLFGVITVILVVSVSVLGTCMRYFPKSTFGSLVKCKKYLDLKRYIGCAVLLLSVYVTSIEVLKEKNFVFWQRYAIVAIMASSVGFCFWNCIFEYFGELVARLVRPGPAYEEIV
ncbi:hypothetical protein HDU98_006559 [Podochytrium sp. JEL0797]|nr:hypothetical protein HDU98_006559 [Podochytrium sp. JEL0797]